MIHDRTVLQADSQPSEILHRHDQINHLSEILKPVVNGDRVDGALLYGPTGVGKTCTSKFILERLQTERSDVVTTHIDCWNNSTRSAILHRIAEAVDLTSGLNRTDPPDELSKRLREDLSSPLVAILDEADQIRDQEVLYDLYQHSAVTFVLITNDDEEFFASLESRVDSRLVTVPRIHFRKYTDGELTSILEHRADAALTPGSVDRDVLEVIADAAAGDARVAIGILRNAAQRATSDGQNQITSEVIDSVYDVARTEVRRRTISSLTAHQREILAVLCEHEPLSMGELYPRYSERVDEPRGERMVRNYLSKMIHYDLIIADGQKGGRKYQPAEEIGHLREHLNGSAHRPE